MVSTPRSVRVAVIQDAPVVFELEPTLEKVAELASRAVTFLVNDPEVVSSRERSSVPRLW